MNTLRSLELESGRADVIQCTVGAIGFAGQADAAAMEDEQMTKDGPAVFGE